MPAGKKHTIEVFNGLVTYGIGNHAAVDPHEATGQTWKRIEALRIADGSVAWQTEVPIDGAIFNILYDEPNRRLVAETQYSTQSSEKIFLLDPSTGTRLHTIDTGRVATSCAISRVYDGVLYSGDLLSHQIFRYDLGASTGRVVDSEDSDAGTTGSSGSAG